MNKFINSLYKHCINDNLCLICNKHLIKVDSLMNCNRNNHKMTLFVDKSIILESFDINNLYYIIIAYNNNSISLFFNNKQITSYTTNELNLSDKPFFPDLLLNAMNKLRTFQ